MYGRFAYVLASVMKTICTSRPKEMTTHSSILAWKIPWTEGPGKLQSMGCIESDMTDYARMPYRTKVKQFYFPF